MKETVLRYKAESLEDIAQFLESQADRKSHGDGRNAAVRAAAFREIADLLRRTVLVCPRKPKWLKIGDYATGTSGLQRTGLVEQWVRELGQARVKFGPSGPVEMVRFTDLRPADFNETAIATGEMGHPAEKPKGEAS